MNFGLRCAGAQCGVGVTGARRCFAAQMELEARCGQRLAGQSANKAHGVAVSLSGVVVVERDFNIRHIGDTTGQALVERGISRAHLSDCGGHRSVTPVHRAHFGRRAVNQEQFVFLNHFLSLEYDAISGRLTGTAGLHLAYRCAGCGRRCRGVAHQSEALQFAHTLHRSGGLLHHTVGHEKHIIVTGYRRGGKDDVVDLG